MSIWMWHIYSLMKNKPVVEDTQRKKLCKIET